jgi:hypothetical protein
MVIQILTARISFMNTDLKMLMYGIYYTCQKYKTVISFLECFNDIPTFVKSCISATVAMRVQMGAS